MPIASISFSQTTNISDTINTYHKVLAISMTAAKLDNVSGLSCGNTVLIIQMKGASIVTTNNISFGDTMSLNYAGNYELATICSVSNDTVYFFNQVMHSYDPAYKVQLVKFGEYYSAIVTDTVMAQGWNNATGKGGVLAIKVEEDLTLNAPLFADARGYEGGVDTLYSDNCTDALQANAYYYNGNNLTAFQCGAFKGEGVVELAVNMSGGRGAPANGGGGGNNHNNGGGGGANLGAGGIGGGNFSSTGCTGNRQGLAGKALSNWGGRKIFMGGGGGLGHANNYEPTQGGGNGGGIIFVIAKNIIGNGYKIMANGQTGGGNISDGASGGGAGGTVIMNITNSYSGSLTIEAKGGNGGNSDNDFLANRCYGAGGGGSGGTIYFNGSIPAVTTTITGGSAGGNIDINGCTTPAPAGSGANGTVVPSYAYQVSVNPSSGCTVALPVRIIYFNALLAAGNNVKLEWDIANPEEARSFTIEKINALNNWVEIATVNTVTNLHHYETPDPSPLPGENIYRLRVNGRDNSFIYSLQKRVFVKFNSQFSVYPNPAKNKLTVSGKLEPGKVISFTDITGRILKQTVINSGFTSFEMVLPNIPPGIYLLNIDNWVQKITILH